MTWTVEVELLTQAFFWFFKACHFRCQRSTHEELVEIQKKAVLVACEAQNTEYLPIMEPIVVINKISDEERIQFIGSLKSELVKSTSTNFKLIGSWFSLFKLITYYIYKNVSSSVHA